ncbi:hypothetical protein ANANG_G00097740 [Anguilla anguilla]|uniref:Uncharacterized protein n=1 Tax=Anguilla anguilla TaxID=7936 RepID=A0A9D3RYY1_ANGAN|nr:hypothetical protein ANANG_G00097740 [Anguilla anguilla]
MASWTCPTAVLAAGSTSASEASPPSGRTWSTTTPTRPYVLSKSNSVCDGALVPLAWPPPTPQPRHRRGRGRQRGRQRRGGRHEEGLARLKVRAFEKLELDERLEKLSEEVEQKIAARVGRLQVELERKSSELEKAKQESVRLSQEKQDLEDKASELSRQVDVSVEMLATLKQDLVNKEQELTHKQQEVAQIDQFLQETAAREANAKVRLQQFIEELLDRADRAEKQLQIISSCGTTPNGSLGRCSVPGSKGTSRQRNSSLSGTSRGMYPVSDRHSSPSTGAGPLHRAPGCGAPVDGNVRGQKKAAGRRL